MCGIAGFFLKEPRAFELRESLVAMSKSLQHRGPDDDGLYISDDLRVGLVHRRLSILDLSLSGHQPMTSPSGRYTMVFNGEIYNHNEIKNRHLSGESFHGHSDSETLIRAIDKLGLAATLAEAKGMFALAIYDRAEKKIHLARDRCGEKPLYYQFNEESCIFGSELKALRSHPYFCAEVDPLSLHDLLKYGYIPAPNSIWKNTFKVIPGEIVTIDANGESGAIEYWVQPEGEVDDFRDSSGDFSSICDSVEGLLSNSVMQQMECDVPFGAFLSGGIDSSLVVALMQHHAKKEINTFTIGFWDKDKDEAPYARAVAAALGTNHQEIYISEEDALRLVDQLPHIWDEPFGDASQIPTYLVCALAKQNVKVVLSGDGGDELFWGYPRMIRARARSGLNFRKIRSVLSALKAASLGRDCEMARKQIAIFSSWQPVDSYIASVSQASSLERFLTSQTICERAADRAVLPPRLSNDDDIEGWIRIFERTRYLSDDIFVKVDRASMSNSIEVRSPYLDVELIRYSAKIPFSTSVSGEDGKQILRAILSRHLPHSLFDRPKKGFSVPISRWLRGPLKAWAEDLLHCELARDEAINGRAVMRLWAQYMKGSNQLNGFFWSLLQYLSWRRINCASL